VSPHRPQGTAAAPPAAAVPPLPWFEVGLESLIGNGLGAGVYRRWVASLPLAGDEHVLDIGTGAGACARHLAAALPSGHLTCLDSDPRWLAIAGNRLARFGSRVDLVVGDATVWSRPAAFDAAVTHFVLHDIAPALRLTALRHIAESLRPGGRLYVREPVTHGMSAQELQAQLGAAGFVQVRADVRSIVPLMGDTVSAEWQKRSC